MAEAARNHPVHSTSESAAGQDLVLVVDDQKSVVQLIARYLARKGYEVVTARSGLEALKRFGERTPAAVVSDIRMPDIDGMQLLDRLTELDPDVVVIMATGAPSMELTIKALRAGAADFLPKPISLPHLLETLSRGIARRHARLDSRKRQDWLEERVRERTEELQDVLAALRQANTALTDAYEGSIEMLRRTSALRDNDTGAHIDRIRLFSEIVARTLDLTPDDVHLLRGASPMHDIGKIGIPDHILLKPGPLTPGEFETMKRHTLIGAEILSGYEVPILRASAEIALTHHERWDGRGYPNGLAKTEIPLFGRILATVDVWDALTHERCYKAAFSTERSLSIMKEERERRFDPEVLDAFLDSIPRILEAEEEVRITHGESASQLPLG